MIEFIRIRLRVCSLSLSVLSEACFLYLDNIGFGIRADVYVTGSNSKMLSSDILTEFRGRGDEIRVNPLSFSEFYNAYTGDTIAKYLDYFMDAFLLYKAQRFDIKGRKYIGSPLKYYFSDIGLRNARLNFRQQEENHVMENKKVPRKQQVGLKIINIFC